VVTTSSAARPGRFRAVLFDWDGTLVDSADLSYRCYVTAFATFGISFSREDYARTYSPDWHRTYEMVGVPKERYDEADARWIEAYAREATSLLPGARETLESVHERGIAQGLVTSGDRGRVEKEILDLGVASFFSALVCGGDVARRKPDPLPLLTALGQLGVEGRDAAYVGDSPEDVQMARAAGAYTVGIPGGFPNREALLASRPDVFCESLAEVTRALLG
jgi:HAD superfamily hydrolase (TIGR01509 family)